MSAGRFDDYANCFVPFTPVPFTRGRFRKRSDTIKRRRFSATIYANRTDRVSGTSFVRGTRNTISDRAGETTNIRSLYIYRERAPPGYNGRI